MLHTVTDEFLQDSYPTTRDKNTSGPIKAGLQRHFLNPGEFRAKLAKKIEELRQLEISDSRILHEIQSQASEENSMQMGTVKHRMRDLQDSVVDNELFMTFLQH